jgi:hypothetical protein
MKFMQNLDTINSLLQEPGTTAMGAYALGVVSVLASEDGVIAPDSLLRAAAMCQTIKEAVELYRRRPMADGAPL